MKKRKRTSFNFIFCPNTKIIERGLSYCSWFSLDYVTFSCNVSTSKRSRWVEEIQCEMPWADGELMKPWCKCYVASQPIFYTTTVQQSWKTPSKETSHPQNHSTVSTSPALHPPPAFFLPLRPRLLIILTSTLHPWCIWTLSFYQSASYSWVNVCIWFMSSHTRPNQAS